MTTNRKVAWWLFRALWYGLSAPIMLCATLLYIKRLEDWPISVAGLFMVSMALRDFLRVWNEKST